MLHPLPYLKSPARGPTKACLESSADSFRGSFVRNCYLTNRVTGRGIQPELNLCCSEPPKITSWTLARSERSPTGALPLSQDEKPIARFASSPVAIASCQYLHYGVQKLLSMLGVTSACARAGKRARLFVLSVFGTRRSQKVSV